MSFCAVPGGACFSAVATSVRTGTMRVAGGVVRALVMRSYQTGQRLQGPGRWEDQGDRRDGRKERGEIPSREYTRIS